MANKVDKGMDQSATVAEVYRKKVSCPVPSETTQLRPQRIASHGRSSQESATSTVFATYKGRCGS